jgi:hypothetical protein
VAAFFDNAAAVKDDDPVHRGDGGQAVGDGEDGLALHHAGEGLLDRGFDFAVEGGGGLVQHEDRRVLQEGAGESDALALAAGQFHAAFAQEGVIAFAVLVVDHRRDEFVRLGGLGGGDDLVLGRLGSAIGDVVAGRAVEHRGFLRDHADLAAQGFLRDGAKIVAVDCDRPFGVVEAQEERDERGFARAGCPHDGQLFAGADREVDVADTAAVAAVGER